MERGHFQSRNGIHLRSHLKVLFYGNVNKYYSDFIFFSELLMIIWHIALQSLAFFLVSSLQKMPLEFNSFVRYHQ